MRIFVLNAMATSKKYTSLLAFIFIFWLVSSSPIAHIL